MLRKNFQNTDGKRTRVLTILVPYCLMVVVQCILTARFTQVGACQFRNSMLSVSCKTQTKMYQFSNEETEIVFPTINVQIWEHVVFRIR